MVGEFKVSGYVMPMGGFGEICSAVAVCWQQTKPGAKPQGLTNRYATLLTPSGRVFAVKVELTRISFSCR